ncbi:hypothetical protein H0H93_010501 [Arthromyces matolae]|nr:hypothetical protein H0H93_010501 [Arthromyces matolae]
MYIESRSPTVAVFGREEPRNMAVVAYLAERHRTTLNTKRAHHLSRPTQPPRHRLSSSSSPMATATANPFLSPAPSPHPTGATASHDTSTAPPHIDVLDEELPPAYTPAPDIQHGETTVQYGPQRPFQRAPAPVTLQPQPVAQSHLSPTSPLSQPTLYSSSSPPRSPRPRSLLRQIRESISAAIDEATYNMDSSLNPSRPANASSSWSSYPGATQAAGRSTSSSGNLGPSTSSNNRLQPPPLPPRAASTTNAGSNPASPTSDFARDFYASGTGEQRSGGTTSSPTTGSYAPPAGPPPSSSSRTGSSSTSPTTSNSNAPTTTPTPGRPLLRDGKLLVYPKGFVCHKCMFLNE